MKIDAHHHFWRYDPVEYGWMGEEMSVIRRDFQRDDLQAEIQAAGIDSVVSVQARQTLAETVDLLTTARTTPFVKGVVGWVPLVSKSVADDLDALAHPKLRGMRHVLQGEPDDRYMLRDDFNAGVRRLTERGLVFDILIFERHLPQAIEFVDRHPSQVFVLDHIAKPRIKEGVFEPWNARIRKLAERPNVFCKLSGMVTEAHWTNWTEADLRPYAGAVLEAFGPARTIFGSDWPVCLVASGYRRWLEAVRHFADGFSPNERDQLFGGTAVRVYGLK